MKGSECIWILIIMAGVTAVNLSSPTTSAPKDFSAEAQKLFQDYFQWKMSQYPEYATYIGIHDNDALLNDMTESALLSRFQKCQQFLTEANGLQPSLTDEADILNMKILKYELGTYIDYFDLKGYYVPITYRAGLHSSLQRLLKRMPLITYNDYDVMIKRLEKIPINIDSTIVLMKAGVKSNITTHAVSMKNLNESIGTFIVEDPTESPLYTFFNDSYPASFTGEEIAELQTRAASVIDQKVVPAFTKLLSYIQDEYITREDIAVSSINRGKEFYDSLIWFYTSSNYTAQEIHDIGLREVERIEGEMLKVIKETGKEGMSTQEFSALIRDDPNNYFNTSEDIVAAFEHIVFNRVTPHLLRIFKSIPKLGLTVKADTTPKRSGAYYVRGSVDGSKPGTFYVRTHYPESLPKFRMMSLALHEANPGHHFQNSYLIESPNLPQFRKTKGGGMPNAYPSRFPSYTYMSEGWALYAEALGFDMDLYQDPLERFGHYNEEMYRAVRLVVDTGMHALGWTRDEAVDYMSNHTALSTIGVENQIDRYITKPGQALAYKMGQLKIQLLRALSEARLCQHFDLKEFHDVILRSFASLDIVEDEVQKWIERNIPKGECEATNAPTSN